jgi:hypothetical protein
MFSAVIIIPVLAWAALHNAANGYTFPADFDRALRETGVRVTDKCRSVHAGYGAKYSAHKKCQAADIGKETTPAQIAALRQKGFCPEFHRAGTGPHYHVTRCNGSQTTQIAQNEQRSRLDNIRQTNNDFVQTASLSPSASPQLLPPERSPASFSGGGSLGRGPDYSSLIMLWMAFHLMNQQNRPAGVAL